MNIPPPLNTVASAIDAAHEANQEPPRPHLGASIIGHKCDRFIWLSFRWAVREQFQGRILRLFRRGHNEERTIHDDLRLIGCNVKTIDPETRKQYRFDDGHFGGSCDGIIASGLPEAPKKPHVLEAKTHSLKSFNDLEKNGVQKSKPQHWSQMQVYMAAFDLDDALYYAVCKDDDRIYTERVKRDAKAGADLVEKAQRLIAADRMPEPLSADPSWFECKWCAAHDQCHGSKLTKQVNCRTCLHSTAERDGRWTCAHWGMDIPDVDAQRNGCDSHLLHPDLVPPDWSYEPKTEEGVIWLTPAGKIDQPEHSSAEIVANWQACASGIKNEWAHFGARVVG
jgi:hypothetical protein